MNTLFPLLTEIFTKTFETGYHFKDENECEILFLKI